MMTTDDFKRLVETYGSNAARWPEEQRSEMQAFMRVHPKVAESILLSEQILDETLDSVRLEPGTDMLKARILSSLPEAREDVLPTPANNNLARFSQKAVAALMLLAFTVGFAGASFLKLPTTGENETYDVATADWEELAEDYGMDEIYAWVEATPAP